jgi:hypothetical protein
VLGYRRGDMRVSELEQVLKQTTTWTMTRRAVVRQFDELISHTVKCRRRRRRRRTRFRGEDRSPRREGGRAPVNDA